MDGKYFDAQPENKPVELPGKPGVLYYEITEAWRCWWKYRGVRRDLSVPSGYIYDGTSAPRPVWSITGITPDGLGRAAGLAHDALYRAMGGAKPEGWKGCILVTDTTKPMITRSEADWLLREFMVAACMRKTQAGIAWAAVRVAGWKYWGKTSPTDQK